MFEVFGFYKFIKIRSVKKNKVLLQDFLISKKIRGTIINVKFSKQKIKFNKPGGAPARAAPRDPPGCRYSMIFKTKNNSRPRLVDYQTSPRSHPPVLWICTYHG